MQHFQALQDLCIFVSLQTHNFSKHSVWKYQRFWWNFSNNLKAIYQLAPNLPNFDVSARCFWQMLNLKLDDLEFSMLHRGNASRFLKYLAGWICAVLPWQSQRTARWITEYVVRLVAFWCRIWYWTASIEFLVTLDRFSDSLFDRVLQTFSWTTKNWRPGCTGRRTGISASDFKLTIFWCWNAIWRLTEAF